MPAFESFQPLVAIATTPQAAHLLAPFIADCGGQLWAPQAWVPTAQVYSGSLQEQLRLLWPSARSIIFGLALGATVRLIAPLLQDKASDPAILVVDAQGHYVISVCGGHGRGADELARGIAAWLQATPILTGAATGLNWPGMDTFGLPFGWRLGSGDWTQVSAIAVQGHPIQVQQSAGSELWRSLFSCDHPLGKPTADPDVAPAATIFIQCQRQRPVDWPTEQPRIYWHPPVLWIGVGCERGTPACLISQAIDAVLTEYQLATDAVAGIATLTLKQDEVGLREVCADQDWPMRCFDAEQLSVIPVPNPSDQVAAAVATPSVAEAAALLAAQTVGPEATPASLIAPKQIFRVPDQPGAVTVAIAQSPWEWLGASGHLALIGTGPGALSQMTPAAQAALRDAQVVIGYGLYLDLLESQRRPGQGWEASPITQERQRAQRAIALAQWGLRVAVVSSGDAGIYGMAGLVMEELQAQGWEGQTPSVEVYPGITALQAAAARVGTPLMHDFCAISLSDLLTPWSVIEARLIAAAQADFVTALYNPRSQTRQTHLDTAQRIFLAHRDPNTPVAVVRAAYRPEESIQTSTLEKLHTLEVDMLSLVIIGNQSSRFVHQWMITPRGYLGFNKT